MSKDQWEIIRDMYIATVLVFQQHIISFIYWQLRMIPMIIRIETEISTISVK